MNQRGFTLLELIIAITMLAVIVAFMTGALTMSYRTVAKGEEKIEDLERRKAVFFLIESQIQSAFASFYTEQGETKSRFAGAKDSLSFASNYSIWRGVGGNCLVRYFVKTEESGRSVLYAEEQIPGLSVINMTRLTDDHEAIAFEYYLENSLEEGKWVEEWPEEEKNLPRRIRMTLADGLQKRVLTANVFVRTNAVTTVFSPQPVVTK